MVGPFCFAFIWFRGQGSRGGFAAFLIGLCPEVAFKLPVIPLISGEWIVSHMWHEILRLSPHLFCLGLFTHRAFSSAQDDDTGERTGFHLGDTLRVLELSVLYTIRVGPWRRAAPKAQDGSTQRCERLCEAIRLRGSFVVWTRLRRLFFEDGILVSQPSPLG